MPACTQICFKDEGVFTALNEKAPKVDYYFSYFGSNIASTETMYSSSIKLTNIGRHLRR